MPCKFWELGLITKLISGPDGQVRIAKLRTKNGLTNQGIRKLHPIGVTAQGPTEEPRPQVENELPQEQPLPQVHPELRPRQSRRRAAEQARKRIQQQAADALTDLDD